MDAVPVGGRLSTYAIVSEQVVRKPDTPRTRDVKDLTTIGSISAVAEAT
jgi:hypothetical protein